MLHYHYGVIDISALDEVVAEEELKFVEEAECAARRNLPDIVLRAVEMHFLDSQHAGVEIRRQVHAEIASRSDAYIRT